MEDTWLPTLSTVNETHSHCVQAAVDYGHMSHRLRQQHFVEYDEVLWALGWFRGVMHNYIHYAPKAGPHTFGNVLNTNSSGVHAAAQQVFGACSYIRAVAVRTMCMFDSHLLSTHRSLPRQALADAPKACCRFGKPFSWPTPPPWFLQAVKRVGGTAVARKPTARGATAAAARSTPAPHAAHANRWPADRSHGIPSHKEQNAVRLREEGSECTRVRTREESSSGGSSTAVLCVPPAHQRGREDGGPAEMPKNGDVDYRAFLS